MADVFSAPVASTLAPWLVPGSTMVTSWPAANAVPAIAATSAMTATTNAGVTLNLRMLLPPAGTSGAWGGHESYPADAPAREVHSDDRGSSSRTIPNGADDESNAGGVFDVLRPRAGGGTGVRSGDPALGRAGVPCGLPTASWRERMHLRRRTPAVVMAAAATAAAIAGATVISATGSSGSPNANAGASGRSVDCTAKTFSAGVGAN